ncbi:hypothetical protein H2198_007235 [Neophaeococcomyces mojaviensis]|uniref:Uncharacterized protein n=1 Tax=Neophaeococcomyces mojaviensis TaxID=3383035 RepID=A0ACC3A0I1_9EURO|nr:hypothetical protein H2198_007235 [Knufia sp. JES_112]
MPNSSFAPGHGDSRNESTASSVILSVDTRSHPALPRTKTSLSANDARLEEHDERTALLSASDSPVWRNYTRSGGTTPGPTGLSRISSMVGSLRSRKTPTRADTWAHAYPSSPLFLRASGLRTPRLNQSVAGRLMADERVWYDQFTSTDWVHDSIADGYRVLQLRRLKGWRGRASVWFDSIQGWILVFLIGVLTALVAYCIDVSESAIFDIKRGYCSDKPWLSHKDCCLGGTSCARWRTWSELIRSSNERRVWLDYMVFVLWCILLACASCFLTLFSKTVVPSSIAATFDENLGAARRASENLQDDKVDSLPRPLIEDNPLPASIYYSAAGSGVAEVKVILSGFVLHGYLGLRTLILKVFALILSVSSGMSLGKEGPYVHIATCIGNVACRLFAKYNDNDGKRREVLSASASSGVAVAFGSPLGGVLFGLEEVSYYFPPKTLFRTFFCCIAAALGLKFLNPYGTSKIVLFEVRYVTDWRVFELFWFAFLGFAGGLAGALFIKASKFWAETFRRIPLIKAYPMLEVLLVALITGLTSFWNRYTRLPVAELLAELASPCTQGSAGMTGLCPAAEDIPSVIWYLLMALVIKALLTIITFGIKVPAGIYVPSMVVGGLMGRIVGHSVQYLVYRFPDSWAFGYCSNTSSGSIEECITPGIYALVAAGATMCGVTRLTITLAVILFELTGSLDHVLPFSLAILFAKWTADAVEPHSIYDLLTDMNSYPFLDNKVSPVFDSELGDIVPRLRIDKLIDITISPYVKASELRTKLNRLQSAGELDGGLPIVREKILIGLIPVPDLEFALDKLETPEEETMCLMSTSSHPSNPHHHGWPGTNMNLGASFNSSMLADDEGSISDHSVSEPADLTPFIDPAPVALDIHSPMDLVYQCFVKLGLRYVCVVSDGQYRGMVHKKKFVKYIKTCDDGS